MPLEFDPYSDSAKDTAPDGHDEWPAGTDANFIEKRLKQFEEAWGRHLRTKVHAHTPDVYRFCEADFHYGRLLGQGSFSCVHKVSLRHESVKILGQNSELCDHEYAMKRLKTCVLADPARAEIAVSDLIVETSILMNLQHENIVKLHGVKEGDSLASLKQGNFFLLLELLVDTLDVRLVRWQKNQPRRFFHWRNKQRQPGNCVANKLENVALGIAEGMEYLHSKKLIFRDLKPNNIGFDESDRVKIFDFGLARDCRREPVVGKAPRRGSCPRLMTGGAGTPRYMAPEVFRMDDAAYGFPADVYSFSILLWHLVANQMPYVSWSTPSVFVEKVVKGKKRPDLKLIQSESLKLLLNVSWSNDPDERPGFDMICNLLKNTIIPEYKNHYHIQKSKRIGPRRSFSRSVSRRGNFGTASIGKSSFRTAETTRLSNSSHGASQHHHHVYVSHRGEIASQRLEGQVNSHVVSSLAERSRVGMSACLHEQMKADWKEFRCETHAIGHMSNT